MRLTDCFVELIAYTAYFQRNVERAQPPFDKVKADIRRLIAQSEGTMQEGGFSQEDYAMARFAVFAWIDEAILGSLWQEKGRWLGEQLQRLYYNTTDAGEIFFQRLNTIGLHQRDVREVYYICLAMGFAGRYCHEGDEFLLDQLKTANLKLLTGSPGGLASLGKGELFPEAYSNQSQEFATRQGNRMFSPFVLFFLSFPLVFFGALFMTYGFILRHIGENLLKAVP
jgi:type VI secretion system protein ImpK